MNIYSNKYPSKEELYFYETLNFIGKEIVNLEDFKMISQEKGEKVFNSLKRKKLLIKYFDNNYIFLFNYNINPKIRIENLVKNYIEARGKDYYFGGVKIINNYRITEQMGSYAVVYNNYINGWKNFNGTKVLFKKTNRLDILNKFKTDEQKKEFLNLSIKEFTDYSGNSFNISTLEQTIYDIIEEPGYIGGDYDKLVIFFKDNKQNINVDNLIKLFEIYGIKSNLLKLFYLLNKASISFEENILLKYTKNEKIYRKLYNNKNPIIKKDKKFKLYIN